jgi:hypothetical protein
MEKGSAGLGMMTVWTLRVFLVLALMMPGIANAGAIDDAQIFFGRYAALEKAFDPAMADLYSEEAYIKNTRYYPDGQSKEMVIKGIDYKRLVRAALPIAKARGDSNIYSDVVYTEENGAVRIRAIRFSELKKYESPISLLVMAGHDGKYRIYEEISESRP